MRTIFIFLSIYLSLFSQPLFSQTYSIVNCPYNYYVPSGGTNLTLGDDELKVVPIPFNFTFFDNSYSQVYVCSNGYITFNNVPTATGCCSGQGLPNATAPNNLIAAAWEDLYPPAGGTISYKTEGTAPSRVFVVTWDNVPHFAAGHQVFMQIQLHEALNEVRIMLQNMPSDGGLHTLGLENATGTVAYTPLGRNRANWSATNEAWAFVNCTSLTAPNCTSPTVNQGQSVSLSASGLPSATLRWFDASAGGNLLATGATFTTPALLNPDTFYVDQTTGTCTSQRNAVTVEVMSSPLPITLVNFTGESKEKSNTLHWNTTMETSASHFEIEKKNPNNEIYEQIGQIQARNLINGSLYLYEDNQPLIGKNTYRLKMMDINGAFSYSKEIEILHASAQEIQIYPNPASEVIHISLQNTENETVIFSLINELGEEVLHNAYETKGQGIATIHLQGLSSGVYCYKIHTFSQKKTGRLVVVNE